MELSKCLLEIADKDGLPADHVIRVTAQELNKALSRDKKEKDFAETLIEAQSKAFAAYAFYTGKMFESESDDDLMIP